MSNNDSEMDWGMRMDGPASNDPDGILFRWFLFGKTGMLLLTAIIWYLGGQAAATETVSTAPWPLAGVAFFAAAVAFSLPGMAVFFACIAVGFRKWAASQS